jgi:hypothetical protein
VNENPLPLSTGLTTVKVEVLANTQGVGIVVQKPAVHILGKAVAKIVR